MSGEISKKSHIFENLLFYDKISRSIKFLIRIIYRGRIFFVAPEQPKTET